MRWLKTEYLLKGIFLGLLLDIALREARRGTFDWAPPLQVLLCTVGGLAVALLLAAVVKLRAGYRIRGRLPAFILFLLLESPTLVYAGILAGLVGGAWWITFAGAELTDVQVESLREQMFQMVVGGAVLGAALGLLRVVRDQRTRFGLSLALGGSLVSLAAYQLGYLDGEVRLELTDRGETTLGVFLLLGLPIFYLLTFAGQEEETEAEVGAMCGTLGVALVLLTPKSASPGTKVLAFLIPVILYFWYTIRVLPGLRVFKHVLRGMSHAAVGRFKNALLAFRRALQLDARHSLAREEYWKVHVSLDFHQLQKDPELLALVDFKLCVERAGTLLMEKPTPERLSESNRLLDLVLSQKPALKPAVDYWRAVGLTHERKLDEAADLLNHLLDPEKYQKGDAHRRAVLMQAWQLALILHEELRRRVGQPQLALPGRRMEAIAAVERHWQQSPDDQAVWPLKRLLYQDLAEPEFEQACAGGKPPELFDYGYAQQLGTALIEDPVRWARGAEYLRMAACGMAPQAPTIYTQVAQAYERAGDRPKMLESYEQAKAAGLAVGHANLADTEKQTFFRAVKILGEEAMARGDLDAALDNFNLFAEWDRSGIETLRTIAELYERKEDALAALRITDRALVYNPRDADLLARKDRYYYSVTPEVLRANLEAAGPELDLNYCTTKAKTILDFPEIDLDSLDWADHLLSLALVVKPDNRPLRVLKGRAHWRRGDVEQAAAVLEGVRTPKPEKFAGAEDEEAWYLACQLLGDLYLNNLGKPQEAVACLNDYRKSPKSGARTWHRLGQAYEQLGDAARAVKCYQQVAAYDGNPLQYEAQEALSRLGHS